MQLMYSLYETDSMHSVTNLERFLIPLFQSNRIISDVTSFL